MFRTVAATSRRVKAAAAMRVRVLSSTKKIVSQALITTPSTRMPGGRLGICAARSTRNRSTTISTQRRHCVAAGAISGAPATATPVAAMASGSDANGNTKVQQMLTAAMAATIAAGMTTTTVLLEEQTEEQQDEDNFNGDAQVTATSFAEMHAPLECVRDLGKALAELHERQKVKLGRLLNDFHQLAEEAKAMGSNAVAASEEEVCVAEQKHEVDDDIQGQVTYVDVVDDLANITPRAAWDIISSLRKGDLLRREDVKRVALAAADALRREPTVIDLRSRGDIEAVTVVGDLHGQFSSLFDVLGLVGDHGFGAHGDVGVGGAGRGTPWDGSGAVVFNGDFVDRGENSLEVMLSLLLLKLAFPNHVFLNRGNHEDKILSTVYGYTDELKERYNSSSIDDIWETIGEVFCALPLCVRTQTAAIMHGGIPHKGFQLSELESITPEQRSKIDSVLEPEDDVLCQLVQNVMWSDPHPDPGVRPNEDRGAGVQFGPDITDQFLRDHGLKFLIRSHEAVDAGYEHIECSDGHSAVTVFSAAQYPNGEGLNWGAVVRLSSDGKYEPLSFPGQYHAENVGNHEYEQRTFSDLAKLIAENKLRLTSAFSEMAEVNKGGGHTLSGSSPLTNESALITREQWANVMSHQLDLLHLDWLSLQPYLAPTALENNPGEGTKVKDTGLIDYNKFLDLHCNTVSSSEGMQQLDDKTMELLHENHAMLLTVFKFLDTNHNGLIDREEFRAGIELLNRRFPHNKQFEDPDAVFDAIDLDRSGEIELDEFEKAFQAVEMPYAVAVFKVFDADHSGTIDREEFQEALKMLNERLPPNQHFPLEKADDLFDELDDDGNGELDVEEFRKVVRDYLPDKLG